MKVEVKGTTDIVIASDITIKNLSFMHLINLHKGDSLVDRVFDFEDSHARETRPEGEFFVEVTIKEINILECEPITKVNQG